MCRLYSVGGLTAHHSCDSHLATFSTQLFVSPTRAQRLLPKMSWSCTPLNFQKLSQIVSPTGTTIPAASRLGATTSQAHHVGNPPACGTTVWQGCDGGFKGGTSAAHQRRGVETWQRQAGAPQALAVQRRKKRDGHNRNTNKSHIVSPFEDEEGGREKQSICTCSMYNMYMNIICNYIYIYIYISSSFIKLPPAIGNGRA